MVAKGGIEPPTHGFSDCSKSWILAAFLGGLRIQIEELLVLRIELRVFLPPAKGATQKWDREKLRIAVS